MAPSLLANAPLGAVAGRSHGKLNSFSIRISDGEAIQLAFASLYTDTVAGNRPASVGMFVDQR